MHARFIGNCLLGYWVTLHPTLGQLTPVFLFFFLPHVASCQRFNPKNFQIKNFYPPIAILCDLHLHQLFIVCITLFFFSFFWLCSYSHWRQHLLPYSLCYVMAAVIHTLVWPRAKPCSKTIKSSKIPITLPWNHRFHSTSTRQGRTVLLQVTFHANTSSYGPCRVQEPMTFGAVGVQVKLNALMHLASLQDIILRCQDVEAVLDHVRQTACRVCRNFV